MDIERIDDGITRLRAIESKIEIGSRQHDCLCAGFHHAAPRIDEEPALLRRADARDGDILISLPKHLDLVIEGEGARPSPATPEEFTALLRTEIARWREVARVANIHLD